MSEPVRLKHKMKLPWHVTLLSGAFHARKRQLYVVGGAVRDSLLDQHPKDFDLATDALPDEIIEILSDLRDDEACAITPTIIEVGKSFGVIKAIFKPVMDFGIKVKGIELEIATFRSDIGAGRRPDSVEFTSIEKDVMRRDLTINALFYDVATREVVDYVGGIEDIKQGVVRTVGSPKERFAEDRLRVLRAVRFAAQMSCELDLDTFQAIKRNPTLDGVSPERIRDEFLKCIAKTKSMTYLSFLLTRLNLWEAIFPEFVIMASNVREVRDPMQFLAMIIAREEIPGYVADELNKLKYTSAEVKQVIFYKEFAESATYDALRTPNILHKAFVNSGVTPEALRRFSKLKTRPEQFFVDAFLEYTPTVRGDTLMALGFKGKELGVELAQREAVLFGRLLDEHRTKHQKST